MHYLSDLTIKNFRSCEDLHIKLSAYTPLVGYNNAGKSNILSAIQWLLKKCSLAESDFYSLENPVEVNATVEGVTEELLGNMPQNQRNALIPYIHDNKLQIRRIQNMPNAKATDIKICVFDSNSGQWRENPSGIDNALKALLPEPIRIGAMENAEEDSTKAKSTTTIGKLLERLLTSIEEHYAQTLNEPLNEVNKQITFDGENRLNELEDIDEGLNQKIDDFFPGLKVKLHFEAPNISNIFKNGTIKVFENNSNIGRNLSCYGHGAQRSIQMALIRKLAEINTQETPITTLLLIDEPELYLHPMAIEQLRAALKNLSRNGYQVIFSTHSAQMISADDAMNTLLIRKPNSTTECLSRFSDAVQAKIPDDLTSQRELLFSLTNSSKILFAEKVLLTEGTTEQRLLPYIFEKISSETLGQKKIALVSLGGTGNIKKALMVLAEIGIPVSVVVDLDYAFRHAQEHGYIETEDPNISSLKQILNSLSLNHQIVLDDTTRLPKKGKIQRSDGSQDSINAADGYQILAATDGAQEPIQNLHENMKNHNIWLWKKGTIEVHLGLSAKDERAWSAYKNRLDAENLEDVISDYSSLRDLTNWLLRE